MSISESKLRRIVRSVIEESSGVLAESYFNEYDFIDSCELDDLKQALSVYERRYLRDKQGDETLHKFLSDWCREAKFDKKQI